MAVVASSPYWLYQIWAFILPGLHASERKWSRIFAAIAGPLFFTGVAVGYYTLPKAIEVLISFTPENVTNLVEFGKFFSFITRMLLVFGISFEIPLFVVMLNLAGVVSGKALGRYRPWIIIGTFVFAAVATPSTDPFSMLFLAVPMLVLFAIAEVIAASLDRARGRGRDSTEQWGGRRGLAAVTSPPVADLDPFDLPDWLGDGPVSWASDEGLSGHLIAGHLTGAPDQVLPCDLFAVDQAYPTPVLDEATRTRVHQMWRHGQVLLLTREGRATVATPGTSWTSDQVLVALTRVARAVGTDPGRWSARLGLS